MPLLAPIDAETLAIVDKGRWHVVDVRSGAPTAWGEADRVPGKGGAWEIGPNAVTWRPDGGATTPVWTGALDGYATDGTAFWARVGDKVEKVGAGVSLRAPGALVMGADAGGLAWASRERVTRVGADGRQTCSLDIAGAPLAVAADDQHLALADSAGILLIELQKCQVVATSSAVAAALTWVGGTLYAITSGGLQSFDTSLDAPPGYRIGFLGLDGPTPSLFVGTGLYQLGSATFTALPPTAGFDASTILTSDDHRFSVFDSAGRLVAEDDVLPLPAVSYDVWDGRVAVTDGASVRLFGVGTVRPGGAVTAVQVLEGTQVAMLVDDAWSVADLKSGKVTPIAPMAGPVRAGAGVNAAWLPVAGEVTMAVRRMPGGVGVVDPRTGRAVGVPIPIDGDLSRMTVRASADLRMVVAADTAELRAWSTATGALLWRVPETGTVARVGTSVIEIVGSKEKVRARDPATGGALDAGFVVLAPEKAPGATLPAWKGHAAALAAPTIGGAVNDALGLVHSFAPLLEWPTPRSWGGWCGRSEIAQGALAPLPTLRERVTAALGACGVSAPTFTAEVPATTPVTTDEACSGTVWSGGAELSLPVDPTRELLVTTAVDRPPLVPDSVDVLLLTDDPMQPARWSRPVRLGSPRQPLPACLAAIADGGAAWIGKDGHVRARGAVPAVAQALRAGGGTAPTPKLRIATRGAIASVHPVDGGAVILSDQGLARVDHDGKVRWSVRGGGTLVDVVGDLVVRVDGNRVRALDLADGHTLWQAAARYVGPDGDAVILLDRGVQLSVGRDGARRWTHAGPGRRAGGGYEAAVAGWSCRRDGKSLEPGDCGHVVTPPVPYTLNAGLLSFARGRRDSTSLTDVRAVTAVGKRWAVDRGNLGTWMLAEDGQVDAVLPPASALAADGRRVWAVVNGQVEVFEL